MKWGNRRVLITGIAGFIGQNLAKRLLDKGAYVIGFDNFSYGKRENIPVSVNEMITGDVLNKENLVKIKEVDYVFHLGSPSSVVLFNKDPISCFHATVCGFLNILEWAKQRNVEKIVYPSSGSVYGNTPLPQSEDIPPKPVNLYGIAKLTCEILAKKYFNEVPNIGLRIFAGYGPGEWHKGEFASVVTLFLKSIMANEPPIIYGDGSQKRDFVYIDDIVSSFLASVERGIRNTIVNVGSGKAYSFNEVIDLINSLLGTNIKPRYVPKPNSYLENTLSDIRRMKRLLGVNPMGLEEGLKKYLDWLKLSR
ncbi:MAG: NAD-dependent epimerase/dehydratase family protein [Nitrososphaeria archaeon]|uniref:NAD-dependent epimerase/dehydratase family protein n=1 Tax=Saccharolobus sp. TaxID=2100761 RepID=UPI00316026DE